MNAYAETRLPVMAGKLPQRFLPDDTEVEFPGYLTEQIITCIGNKRALLPFIGEALTQVKAVLGKPRLRLVDLFSGSGVVARYFKQHADWLACNDLEDYSRISNACYLANRSDADWPALQAALAGVRHAIGQGWREGFISELYAPRDDDQVQAGERVFYTRRNALYLDTARQAIDEQALSVRHFLLAPLLAKASVHANTSGVFKGFYKSAAGVGQLGGNGRDALSRITAPIEMSLPLLSRFESPVEIVQADANAAARTLPQADLIYLDPPYNQHPYGSNYFMLNLLANYRRPEAISSVSGIPVDWNRSAYNQRPNAENALFDLVEHCRARFVLISYNSEGFIPQDTFLRRLSSFGPLRVMETSYNAFRGSRNLANRPIHVSEHLYLLDKQGKCQHG